MLTYIANYVIYLLSGVFLLGVAPLTVRASTPLDEVALAMSEKKVGRLIVNDDEGRFYGIFTATDALNALVETVRRNTMPGL